MVWGFCVYFVYMIPLETDVNIVSKNAILGYFHIIELVQKVITDCLLIQGQYLHAKDADVPIVRVLMNQQNLFVPIQMKLFYLNMILIALLKMLFI